jgi:hypothetical protein
MDGQGIRRYDIVFPGAGRKVFHVSAVDEAGALEKVRQELELRHEVTWVAMTMREYPPVITLAEPRKGRR